MSRLAASVLLAGLLAAGYAVADEWRMQPRSSRVEFTGTSQGSAFKGRFKSFTPRVRFDPANPAAGSFDVAIELSSATTENSERDQALPTEDFFWVDKFPRARFTADACKATAAPGRFECQGILVLRGKSRKLRFPFAWSGDARRARLASSIVLDRLDFGIGQGDWADPATIGRKVTVNVALELRPAAPPRGAVAAPPKP